jgi:hypothetical protein
MLMPNNQVADVEVGSRRSWLLRTCLYALRDLPDELLTEKGRAELKRVRAEIERLPKHTS